MKVAIIGAGAIGGLVGAKLALAGEDVTFIVRGANLAAIRERGIKLDHARRRRARGDAMSGPPTTTTRRVRRTSSSSR